MMASIERLDQGALWKGCYFGAFVANYDPKVAHTACTVQGPPTFFCAELNSLSPHFTILKHLGVFCDS